jgi:hypothetical protein
MNAREARIEFEAGRLPPEGILNLLERQERLVKHLHAQLQHCQQRLAQYEPEVQQHTTPPRGQGTTRSPAYSLQAEQRRRRRRPHRRKPSTGRRPTKLKFAQAQLVEDVYADDVPHDDCQLLRERAVWRLRDGHAKLIGYRLFGRPGGDEPSIPGVTPRCEHGIEILVVLAFLTYIIGLSLAKACAVLAFFCQLPLSRA